MGGIARTVNYKGNRIDIGGHRFFSKSDRVMQWWLNILPMESLEVPTDSVDRVMLVRSAEVAHLLPPAFLRLPDPAHSGRRSRKLGAVRTIRIGLSYLWSVLFPIKPERSLEQFFINRFGRELYRTFFKDYTEKVWGVPCIADQRRVGSAAGQGPVDRQVDPALPAPTLPQDGPTSRQKGTETSLIEQFLYPKYGPGQMWEEVARRVAAKGGEVLTGWDVRADPCVRRRGDGRHRRARRRPARSRRFEGDCFFSTMPVKDLVRALDAGVPAARSGRSARGSSTATSSRSGCWWTGSRFDEADGSLIRDNWIYIQEPDVQVGRLQIFNNWSPYLVADPSKVWIGLEYFCYERDSLWRRPDRGTDRAGQGRTGEDRHHRRADCPGRDRDPDARRPTRPTSAPTPASAELRQYLDGFENLFLIGRNGMHRYNNQDHSMLTAMTAVDNIVPGVASKENIWAVNTEEEYHEEK